MTELAEARRPGGRRRGFGTCFLDTIRHSSEAAGVPCATSRAPPPSGTACSTPVVDPKRPSPRDVFDAVTRSLQDLVVQRWLKTRETHDREEPTQVSYLSMEVPLGRSLLSTITTLMLEPLVREAAQQKRLGFAPRRVVAAAKGRFVQGARPASGGKAVVRRRHGWRGMAS